MIIYFRKHTTNDFKEKNPTNPFLEKKEEGQAK